MAWLIASFSPVSIDTSSLWILYNTIYFFVLLAFISTIFLCYFVHLIHIYWAKLEIWAMDWRYLINLDTIHLLSPNEIIADIVFKSTILEFCVPTS
ncbi:hypothetical protein ACJX0J_034857, partial [Zea mays]